MSDLKQFKEKKIEEFREKIEFLKYAGFDMAFLTDFFSLTISQSYEQGKADTLSRLRKAVKDDEDGIDTLEEIIKEAKL